jgi:hypothetical protein
MPDEPPAETGDGPPAVEAEGEMHLHRPKPLHGARELLTEIGVIVVGIIIALGLEQAVVSFHEGRITAEARDEVRAEVRENLWWVERREAGEACIGQRLAQIGDLLDRARHRRPYAAAQRVSQGIFAKVTSIRWEANAQAGRASLFTHEEQRYFGNMYYTTDLFSRTQDKEEDVWADMSTMVGLDHLTSQEIDEFSKLLARARLDDSDIRWDILRVHQLADRMHLTADNPNQYEMPRSLLAGQPCLPITAAA